MGLAFRVEPGASLARRAVAELARRHGHAPAGH